MAFLLPAIPAALAMSAETAGVMAATTAAASAFTLADAAAIAGAIGSVVSAGGAIVGGIQEGDAADYNAEVAAQEADAQRAAAGYEADQYLAKSKRLIATQRANAAASGLGLEGSPVEVMEETASQAALDALMIRHSGNVAAARSLSQSSLDRLSGRTQRSNSFYSAGAQVLTGASNLAGVYGKS